MSATTFEIVGRDGAGRLGRFKTAHGTVDTPNILPVINPNLDLISPAEMRAKFGMQILITNSYIIRKKAELRERALAEGVHKLIGWDGPIMTDSGTFQMYVYGKVEVEPQEIVEFQRDIGVDVGTILDIFSTPDRTWTEAQDDYRETISRARAAAAVKGDAMALAATVQGSVYPDLRASCAAAYADVEADFHPIGGVVPLMERQRYRDLVEVIVAAKQNLPPERPVHLFGAGHPMVFPMAALLGCDFFDSASYAKYAADDRLIFPTGTWRLAELTENACCCPVCAARTLDEIRKAEPVERKRLLAEHNLHVTFAELRRVRQAMREGNLWELVEERARSHPTLLDALKAIVRHAPWIETLEPISKPSAYFYAGPESGKRPEVLRARHRLLARFDPRGRDLVLLPASTRPFSAHYEHLLPLIERLPVVASARSVFGPVPFALDEAYPFSQSVEPTEIDDAVANEFEAFLGAFAATHAVRVVDSTGKGRVLEELYAGRSREEARDRDVERVRAVADWQFGRGAGDALLDGTRVDIRKSRNTGKIRTVTVDGAHVLSMRAEDGLFTLKIEGARRLHRAIPAPRLRVVVEADSAPFNREGRNAFAKFVARADPELRPRDECLVVDAADDLVACGQLALAPSEIGRFRVGVAVHVREGESRAVQPVA